MGKLACFLIVVYLVEQSSAGSVPVLGLTCTKSPDCANKVSHSKCDFGNTNVCICTTNYVEEFTVCKVKIDGSTACNATTNECPSNATCAGQCNCNSGYTEASFLCTAIIGMGCASTSRCTDVLANTVCTSSQCACASGYIGTTCTAVVGMECTSTSQCTDALSNTICSSSLCACISGYTGTTCTAVVGMVCTSTSECTDLLANTVLPSSQCACVSGYTGATCTDTIIGMSCANDCDCQDVLLNTVCTSNRCECAAGFCFSGLVCRSSGAGKLSTTTMIPIATILLTVIYMRLV